MKGIDRDTFEAVSELGYETLELSGTRISGANPGPWSKVFNVK